MLELQTIFDQTSIFISLMGIRSSGQSHFSEINIKLDEPKANLPLILSKGSVHKLREEGGGWVI